jgi:ABC-type antimicrobial peptide transport system permease subunit
LGKGGKHDVETDAYSCLIACVGVHRVGQPGRKNQQGAALHLDDNLIAWPIAWWAMQGWLGNFAYWADLEITTFLAAGLLAFALAVATVWIHAYKAARQNPVLSLRHE